MAYSPRQHPTTIAQATGVTDPMKRSSPLTVASGKGDLPSVGALELARASGRPSALDPALQPVVARATPPSGNGPVIVPASGPPPDQEAPYNPYAEAYDQIGGDVRKALSGSGGALQAALDAERKRVEGERGISGEEIAYLQQPKANDMWLQFGAAMLQPTTTGSWAEGFGNAASAAGRARSEWRREEDARQGKLFAARRGLNNLTGEEEAAQLAYNEGVLKMPGAMVSAAGGLSDLQLLGNPSGAMPSGGTQVSGEIGNGTTPNGDEAMIQDYRRNPSKYSGPRGQAMIDDAFARVKQAQVDASKNKSPGQDALDKKMGQEVADWYSMGGEEDYDKQLNQLRLAHRELTSGEDTISGSIVGKLPDGVATMINPKSVSVRDSVSEVVQRNLRTVLGAQFTAKEGDALIARAYNPQLSEKENARRVGALLTQMEASFETKKAAIAYFNRYGTMEGFGRRMPTISDFENAVDNVDAETNASDSNTNQSVERDDGPRIDYGALPASVQNWRQQQIDGGVPAAEVDRIIRQRVLTNN